MASVAITANGTMLMVFESAEKGRFVLDLAASKDGGKTWTRRVLYRPRKERSASAPYICKIGHGRYAVSFQTDEDSEAPGIVKHACAKMLVIDGTGRRIAGPWKVFGRDPYGTLSPC